MTNRPLPNSLFDWLGLKERFDWQAAPRLGRFWGFIASLVIALLPLFFLAALGAAGAVLFDTIRGVAAGTGSGPNLGAGALIAAMLGAPFVIWGTVLKYQTVRFQKEGHITERISQAVEQLGAEKTVKRAGQEESLPNIEVRIGGLLSLERISQDSVAYDKGRDHVRVMEILCAYIRNNAPASEARTSGREDYENEKLRWEDDPDEFDLAFCEENGVRPTDLSDYISLESERRWAWALPKPRADIQLALDIIGRRGAEQCAYEAGWRNGNVAKADWPFGKAPDYPGDKSSRPEAVEHWEKNFAAWTENRQPYTGYRLDLRNTNLQGADLQKANLSGARLEDARMQGASLSRAQMQGANLWRAQMQGASLWRGQMQGASLWEAQMQAASLIGAQMQGAGLSGAQMQGAGLSGAQMQGASLYSANLSETRSLTQAQIDSAMGDEDTILPPHLTRPDHWR